MMCGYLKNAGKDGFEIIFKKFNESYNPLEAIIYLRSLGCSNNIESLQKFFYYLLDC